MDESSLLQSALSGNEPAVRALVDWVSPAVQARVARALLRRGGSQGPEALRTEVEDLTQEVFAILFADGGRVLRNWDASKGLSLKNYVGLVTERRVVSILRTDKRNPWRESPATSGSLEAKITPGDGMEREVLAREFLETVLDRLRLRLSERGLFMFRLLFVEDASPDEVAARLKITRDAVHAWRSRCTKMLRDIADELLVETGRAPGQDPLVAITSASTAS